MDKNSAPKIYGVLGYPAKHSLSPAMHNAAFGHLEINARYETFEVKPEKLEKFLADRDKNNIWGLNVTVPYKEKILDFVTIDEGSSYLKQVRAVNTIVKKENTWKGFNTDILGFSRHLKENFEPYGKSAAILGAGGASRAVAYVLANSGAKEVSIFDIDQEKTRKVIEMMKELSPDFKISAVDSIEQLDIKNKDLLVNATPVGLKESDPCLLNAEMLHKNLFVYDLIYNPKETKLLALARSVGAKSSNGLGMLLYQGAISFEHFTGESAPITIMHEALNKGVAKL